MQVARTPTSATPSAPSSSSFSRQSTSSGPPSLSTPSTSSGPSFSRPSSAESFSRTATLTTPVPEVIVVAERLRPENSHKNKYRDIFQRDEYFKCKGTFTKGQGSSFPEKNGKVDRSDRFDSMYKYQLKNELRNRRLLCICIVQFCLIY